MWDITNMGKIKELDANVSGVTETEVKELRNLSRLKKSKMRFKTFDSFIHGDYKVKIGGMGIKSIKCEIYLDYESILVNKSNGGLEQMIYDTLLTIGEPKTK